LALSLTALGFAQSQSPYTLPPEIEEVVQGASLIVVVDADGNVIWSSDQGVPLNEVELPEGAVLVVYDAEGNAVLELALVAGPKDNVLVQLPDGSLLPPGQLIRELAPGEGEGAMNQHRYRHQTQTQNAGEETPAKAMPKPGKTK